MRLGAAALVLVPAVAAAQPPPLPPSPASKPSARRGLTFEANLGVGLAFADVDGETSTSDLSLAGLDLGLARWFGPRLAIGLRVAGVQIPDEDGESGPSERTVNLFFGPSAQYWFDDHLWAGGGIGLGAFTALDGDGGDILRGLGLDLRAGYSFGRPGSNNSLSFSVELNPCFYFGDVTSGSITGLALVIGYQFL